MEEMEITAKLLQDEGGGNTIGQMTGSMAEGLFLYLVFGQPCHGTKEHQEAAKCACCIPVHD